MNALMRKKQEWEYQNERYLLKLVEASEDVSVESVKRAGLLTSFLVYVMYKICGGVLLVAYAIFKGPKLVRYVSAEKPYEVVQHSLNLYESKIKQPYLS